MGEQFEDGRGRRGESRRAGMSWLVATERLGEPREKSEIIGETGGKGPTTKHTQHTKDGIGRTMGGRTIAGRGRNRRVPARRDKSPGGNALTNGRIAK